MAVVAPSEIEVLFLDFDGVLNTTKYPRNDMAAWIDGEPFTPMNKELHSRLSTLFTERLNLYAVMTTNWRYYFSLQHWQKMLWPIRILSATPKFSVQLQNGTWTSYRRDEEILTWLKNTESTRQYKLLSWVAVDDDSYDMRGINRRFIQINPDVGIQQDHVNRIASLLDLFSIYAATTTPTLLPTDRFPGPSPLR